MQRRRFRLPARPPPAPLAPCLQRGGRPLRTLAAMCGIFSSLPEGGTAAAARPAPVCAANTVDMPPASV